MVLIAVAVAVVESPPPPEGRGEDDDGTLAVIASVELTPSSVSVVAVGSPMVAVMTSVESLPVVVRVMAVGSPIVTEGWGYSVTVVELDSELGTGTDVTSVSEVAPVEEGGNGGDVVSIPGSVLVGVGMGSAPLDVEGRGGTTSVVEDPTATVLDVSRPLVSGPVGTGVSSEVATVEGGGNGGDVVVSTPGKVLVGIGTGSVPLAVEGRGGTTSVVEDPTGTVLDVSRPLVSGPVGTGVISEVAEVGGKGVTSSVVVGGSTTGVEELGGIIDDDESIEDVGSYAVVDGFIGPDELPGVIEGRPGIVSEVKLVDNGGSMLSENMLDTDVGKLGTGVAKLEDSVNRVELSLLEDGTGVSSVTEGEVGTSEGTVAWKRVSFRC